MTRGKIPHLDWKTPRFPLPSSLLLNFVYKLLSNEETSCETFKVDVLAAKWRNSKIDELGPDAKKNLLQTPLG